MDNYQWERDIFDRSIIGGRMTAQTPPELIAFDEFISTDEVRIPVTTKRGEQKTRYVIFSDMDGETLERWRQLSTGGSNPRKANNKAANLLLIERKFIRTEGIAVPTDEKYPNEKTYFLKNPKGYLFMSFVLNNYMLEVIPDTDEIKN